MSLRDMKKKKNTGKKLLIVIIIIFRPLIHYNGKQLIFFGKLCLILNFLQHKNDALHSWKFDKTFARESPFKLI